MNKKKKMQVEEAKPKGVAVVTTQLANTLSMQYY